MNTNNLPREIALHQIHKPREMALHQIRQKLTLNNQSIEQAIEERKLYFRISLVGYCNLSCPFCHNEGASTKGKMDLGFAIKSMKVAFDIGFRRVQFTGGEPLLHPNIADFIREAKKIFEDVGITTNGAYLTQKIESLIEAGVSRIHISLQSELLRNGQNSKHWSTPSWLTTMLDLSSRGYFILRLNLPVPADEISFAKDFLREISIFGCDIKAFAILPEGRTNGFSYPLDSLRSMVLEENSRRARETLRGEVFLRDFRAPSGIRCHNCNAFDKCKEQSHSLRLGADKILRPCLATRIWDKQASDNTLENDIIDASLLALDYTW